jgi:hypothetical protein
MGNKKKIARAEVALVVAQNLTPSQENYRTISERSAPQQLSLT